MTRLRNWYRIVSVRLAIWWLGRSDQWKATLRTAWQSFVGIVLTLVAGTLASAAGWLQNGDLDTFLAELELLAKTAIAAVIVIFTGLVTFLQNRNNAPHYDR